MIDQIINQQMARIYPIGNPLGQSDPALHGKQHQRQAENGKALNPGKGGKQGGSMGHEGRIGAQIEAEKLRHRHRALAPIEAEGDHQGSQAAFAVSCQI